MGEAVGVAVNVRVHVAVEVAVTVAVAVAVGGSIWSPKLTVTTPSGVTVIDTLLGVVEMKPFGSVSCAR